MARRSRSQQNAQRNARIMFAILAILVVMSMVLSLVTSTTPITQPVPTTAARQEILAEARLSTCDGRKPLKLLNALSRKALTTLDKT